MRRLLLASLALVALAGCGSEPPREPPPPAIQDSAAAWSAELQRRREAVPAPAPAAEPRSGVLSIGMSEVDVKALLDGALVEPGVRTIGEYVRDVYEVKFTDTVTTVHFKNGALMGWTGPATVGGPADIGGLPQRQPVTVTLPAAAPPAADVKTPIPYFKKS